MSNIYETDALVSQYLLFHYGTVEDQCSHPFGPTDALFYPIRCVSEFMPGIRTVERALDLGCAVGRSTFEFSRWADNVIGIDLSSRFIAMAKEIQQSGVARIHRLEEGEITTVLGRPLPDSVAPSRVSFEVGDATDLRSDLGTFNVILAANLIDRVNSPPTSPRIIPTTGPPWRLPNSHLALHLARGIHPKIRMARREVRRGRPPNPDSHEHRTNTRTQF